MQLSERDHWTIQLAQGRSRLINAFCGVSAEQATSVADDGAWTLAQIFAHVAVWEERVANLLPAILASDTPAVPTANADEMHGRAFADISARGFVAVLRDLTSARERMLSALAAASDEAIGRERRLPSGKPFTVRAWAIQELADHENEHAAQVRATRRTHKARFTPGPWATLEAAFAASHTYLMACASQVPAGQEQSMPVTGDWTLKDVLGHLADWHFTIANSIDAALADQPLTRVEFQKIQEYNDAHAAVRKDETWLKVRGDYESAWARVNGALARIPEGELTRPAIENERGPVSMYNWLYIAPFHELEHGDFLVEFLQQAEPV